MENNKVIEQLLTQVAIINRHYEESAKISGENFNIFNILDLTSKEMIHSKFIAMLLDPTGEHQMGSLFLKLFIETINIEECNGIDYSDTIVETEKTFTGGRIDILITTGNHKIIIENKIHAKDQNTQLLRYKENYKNAILLYLTKKGNEPDSISTNGMKKEKDYYCISYNKHILDWLKFCINKTNNNDFLREIINQYILLVKQLTGQDRRNEMNNEVLDIIAKNAENLKAYFAVKRINSDDIFQYVLKNKTHPALDKIAKDKGLLFEPNQKTIYEYEYGFKFYKEQRLGEFSILFIFEEILNNLEYGIYDENKRKWQGEIKPIEKYSSWRNNTEILAKLCSDNNDVIKEIENKLTELILEIEKMLNHN